MNTTSPLPVSTKSGAFTVTIKPSWKGITDGTFLFIALNNAFQTYLARFHSVTPDGRLTTDFVSSERSATLEIEMNSMNILNLPVDPTMLAKLACVNDGRTVSSRRWSVAVRRFGSLTGFENDFIFLRNGSFFLKSVAERKLES
jgi:hypothetical protein